MRVPTYKQQTGFGIRGGGGQRLTASLNPNAATAVARTIADIGDAVTEIGMRKLEIETDTEVNTAKKAIVAEFELEKSKAEAVVLNNLANRITYNFLSKFSSRKMKGFDCEEKALEWLKQEQVFV